MYSEIKYFPLITEIRNAGRPRDLSRTNLHLRIPLSEVGFPIRKTADQSFFAAPHGLSQRSTSFIASQRQGIHRMPLRHLIALIINTHPGHEARTVLILKDQLASDRSDGVRSSSRQRIAPTCIGGAIASPADFCGNAMARCSEIAYAIAT